MMIPPRYKPDREKLYGQLKTRVDRAIPDACIGRYLLYFKAAALLLIFCTSLLTSNLVESNGMYLFCMVVAGAISLPLVLNVGHEAVHGNFSPHKTVNQLGRSVYYLLGTSPYLWELRHLSAHHTLPNVTDWDLDIEQSSIIRLSNDQPFAHHHRHQHMYMPIAFCAYTLIWFFYRDLADLQRQSFGVKTVDKHPLLQVCLLLLAKVFHLVLLVGIPYAIHGSSVLVVSGFLVFHVSASIATTFVLVSTHVGEPQEVLDGSKRHLPYTFLEHQLRTTADFATQSPLITHLFGGFNHHVAHHLFPHLPHHHCVVATNVIRAFAVEHGLPYHSFDNLWATIRSHSNRLRSLSTDL